MKPFFILTLLTLSINLQAEILKFDIVGYKRELFQYKEVCKKMTSEHMLLVEVLDPATLDCMGTQVKIVDFCKKHGSEKNLLRGYVNKKLQEVACEFGQKAFLSLGCDKSHKGFCVSPEKGCLELRKFYALSLELNHHAFVEKDVDNVLNCYYGLPLRQKPEIISRPVRPWEEEEVIDRDLFEFSKTQNKSPKSDSL